MKAKLILKERLDIEDLSTLSNVNSIPPLLSLQIAYSPKANDRLPIKLSFKNKVLIDGKHKYSFMYTYWFYLKFPNEENHFEDSENFLQKASRNFLREFYLAVNIKVETRALHALLSEWHTKDYSREIMKEALSLGLIQP